MALPVIGITCDTSAGYTAQQWKYESPCDYARCVSRAGGVPLLLSYEIEAVGCYLKLCDGFLLSGGDDPDTTHYGEPVHPRAKLMHPARQAFEAALLKAIGSTPHPALGVCLGMQMMALHAGGRLHQHLPDAPGLDEVRAGRHHGAPHEVTVLRPGHPHLPRGGIVHSKHHQAVADAGAMRVVAEHDGVIEAIDNPAGSQRFYLGVQWHPECTADPELGMGLIRRFVQACADRKIAS